MYILPALLFLLVVFGGGWRATRLQHLLEQLVADAADGVVLGHGNVGQLVVVAQMGGVRVAVLVGEPLARGG